MTQTETALEGQENTSDDSKPDFSNYTWFPGTNERFNAASVSTHEGRIYLGIKGFDKKSNRPGYIQAEFDPEELRKIQDHIGGLLTSA